MRTGTPWGCCTREMRRLGSLVLAAADTHRLPAGGALAVDRTGFSQDVEARLVAEPLVSLVREEVTQPPDDWDKVIIATGPLTAPALAGAIRTMTGADALAFFDAIAPIVHAETIDMDRAWRQSRYGKGDGADYINCPLSKAQYEDFVASLRAGETGSFKEWEKDTPYFEGCLPIEVMAERGANLRCAGDPMKPIRPHRSAHGTRDLCGGAAAPGQHARHALQHGRLPNEA